MLFNDRTLGDRRHLQPIVQRRRAADRPQRCWASARTAQGIDDRGIYMNSAADGESLGCWRAVEGNATTDAAPAAASLGSRIYVFAKGIDDLHIYLNSALEGQPFDGWGNGWTPVSQ